MKVDKNEPNASKTLKQLEDVQQLCRDNGVLHKRYIHSSFDLLTVLDNPNV